MLGTMVHIVETLGLSTDPKPHQDAVEAVVTKYLRQGAYVLATVTTGNVVPSSQTYTIMRITTIVFAPA